MYSMTIYNFSWFNRWWTTGSFRPFHRASRRDLWCRRSSNWPRCLARPRRRPSLRGWLGCLFRLSGFLWIALRENQGKSERTFHSRSKNFHSINVQFWDGVWRITILLVNQTWWFIIFWPPVFRIFISQKSWWDGERYVNTGLPQLL